MFLAAYQSTDNFWQELPVLNSGFYRYDIRPLGLVFSSRAYTRMFPQYSFWWMPSNSKTNLRLLHKYVVVLVKSISKQYRTLQKQKFRNFARHFFSRLRKWSISYRMLINIWAQYICHYMLYVYKPRAQVRNHVPSFDSFDLVFLDFRMLHFSHVTWLN